jgi:hypothetical protein
MEFHILKQLLDGRCIWSLGAAVCERELDIAFTVRNGSRWKL